MKKSKSGLNDLSTNGSNWIGGECEDTLDQVWQACLLPDRDRASNLKEETPMKNKHIASSQRIYFW